MGGPTSYPNLPPHLTPSSSYKLLHIHFAIPRRGHPHANLHPYWFPLRPLALAPTNRTHTIPPTYITALATEHIDHNALTEYMPQIGELGPHTLPHTANIPTTRNHPPFLLPISKPLIDLYQLGNEDTKHAQTEAATNLRKLLDVKDITTSHIDKVAQLVIDAIDKFHLLAQNIWPMAQQPNGVESTKLRQPINNLETKIERITRL
jgi:hypothetical protein